MKIKLSKEDKVSVVFIGDGATEEGVFNEASAVDLNKAFEIIWELRFTNQIVSHGSLRKVNDDLILKNLSSSDRKNLSWSLSLISGIQSRLSFDFFGMNLV